MKLPARLIDPWFEAGFFAECKDDKSFRIRPEEGPPYELSQAQGLYLWCPCGYEMLDKDGAERFPLDLELNKGRPHWVLVPFSNPPCGVIVPTTFGPKSRDGSSYPRWSVSGTGLDDLTISPSIAVGKPECWHGHIVNGVVQ